MFHLNQIELVNGTLRILIEKQTFIRDIAIKIACFMKTSFFKKKVEMEPIIVIERSNKNSHFFKIIFYCSKSCTAEL